MQNNYGYFEDPGFLKKQEELASLKDKLSKAKNTFKPDKTFDDPYGFDTSYFEKPMEMSTGFGKDPKYMNPMTAKSDEDFTKGLDFMGLSSEKEMGIPTEEISKGTFSGAQGDPISSTVQLGTSVMSSANTMSSSDGEAAMKALDLTMKGATAGMALGGPIGAAIGGGAGLIYGVADGFIDGSGREKKERKEAKEKFIAERTTREQEQRMKDGKDSLEKLTALSKAQLGYMV